MKATLQKHTAKTAKSSGKMASVHFFPATSKLHLVELAIPSSKTGPFCKGVTFTIGLATDPACCAVRLLFKLFTSFPMAPNAPLFSLPSGHPFSHDLLINSIHLLLPAIGENHNHYAGHSFCIGSTAAAANLGYTKYEIKALGQWA
ncbi:hypothetical protein HK100_008042, partial [Physocladia obscura]